MKLYSVDRSNLENKSFTVRENNYPYFLKIWHYHPELELVYVLKSTGTRFIGDSIDKFEAGDVVLLGKNLPHMWQNDEVYFKEESKLKAIAIAIHFKDDFLGNQFLLTPEMSDISNLVKDATYGIYFKNLDAKTKKLIRDLHNYKGFDRAINFLKILNLLARHDEKKFIASEGYVNTTLLHENKKSEKIYEYIFKNFNQKINLSIVADIAHMNPSAFSRYFKKINKKSFSIYLSEIRVGYACKLLIENKYNITQICFESGFNNISNFNKQFKTITKLTPSEYLKTHHK